MREIARGDTGSVAFMIDQSHNVEGKIDAMLQSVMNIQTAYAKALLVDEDRLAAAQGEGTCSAHTASCSRRSRQTSADPGPSPRRGRRGRRPVAAFRADAARDARPRGERGDGALRPSERYASGERRSSPQSRQRGRTMTQRSAFVLEVRPERIEEYVEAHRDVWPEMLDALRRRASGTTPSSGTATGCSATSNPTISRPRRGSWQSRTSRRVAGRDGRAPRGPRAERRRSRPRGDLPARLVCSPAIMCILGSIAVVQ